MKYLFRARRSTIKQKIKQKGHRTFDQFFVCNEDSIYIMDNHRAALWCWLQEITTDKNNKFNLLHIDNHLDMTPKGLDCCFSSKYALKKTSIKQYLIMRHSCKEYGTIPIFSYDNFLRFFLQSFSNIVNVEKAYVTLPYSNNKPTAKKNKIDKNFKKTFGFDKTDDDCYSRAKRLYKNDLLNLLKQDSKEKWIIDLDLDYFYSENTHSLNTELAKEIFTLIKNWYNKKKIVIVTVAWSPEFLINNDNELLNVGFERAKKLNKEFCKIFNIDFNFFKEIL